jgi:hypothetical protein
VGIRDLFKKRSHEEVSSTKILVAFSDPKFQEIADADARSYSLFYSAPTVKRFESFDELFSKIREKYDVIHLFCDVSEDGKVVDRDRRKIEGAALIQTCCDANVKMLWLASENHPERFRKAFESSTNKPLNLVLTVDRRDTRFPVFLEKLLQKMASGETMPAAWVSLSPQNSKDPRSQEGPSCIFAAGRGGVRLL